MRGMKYLEVQPLTEVERAIVGAILRLRNPLEERLRTYLAEQQIACRGFQRHDATNPGEGLGAADEMEMALHGRGDPLHAVGNRGSLGLLTNRKPHERPASPRAVEPKAAATTLTRWHSRCVHTCGSEPESSRAANIAAVTLPGPCSPGAALCGGGPRGAADGFRQTQFVHGANSASRGGLVFRGPAPVHARAAAPWRRNPPGAAYSIRGSLTCRFS